MNRLGFHATRPLAWIILQMIRSYRRWWSPRKGFCCSHRVRHGRSSCSVFGEKAVLRFDPVTALRLIHRRLDSCREAFIRNRSAADAPQDNPPAGADKAKKRGGLCKDAECYCGGGGGGF